MLARTSGGLFVSTVSAIDRFVAKCQFDPGTGCVIWTGGQTSGRGHHAPYGSFWFEGRRWFAHRWAAKFIHDLPIDDLQVDHCCPHDRAGPYERLAPNTLCVQHVQSVPPTVNRELQWIRAQVGLDEPPPVCLDAFAHLPFYETPQWLREIAA